MAYKPKHFSGAGVLLITPKNELLLGFDQTNTARDFGGIRDYSEKCPVTASRELKEESKNTIIVSPAQLAAAPYVDVHAPQGNSFYRCYVVKVACQKGFCTAFKKLPSLGKSSEVTRIVRVPLNGVKANLATNNHKTDINLSITIGGRAMRVIRAAVALKYI